MISQPLGSQGPRVSALGLGTMGMSDMYGPADRAESIATIHAALDAGVTLLDTGDFYGMGHNELLVCEALKGRKREELQISVKFGALRGPGAGEWQGYDSRPAKIERTVPSDAVAGGRYPDAQLAHMDSERSVLAPNRMP